MKSGRRKEPRIHGDPRSHPQQTVCLIVAAEWLGLDDRTVRARIEAGELPAIQDGKVYRIRIQDLLAYDARRRQAIAS